VSNVLQFPTRAERLPRAAPAQASWPNNDGIERDESDLASEGPVVQPEAVSAVGVLKTLAFYASQGFDHGKRARETLEQMHAHAKQQGADRA
jgi:hypothetical protein